MLSTRNVMCLCIAVRVSVMTVCIDEWKCDAHPESKVNFAKGRFGEGDWGNGEREIMLTTLLLLFVILLLLLIILLLI